MSLLNQSGFSIIQGLMLAGLLSGTALVTSQLVSDQKKAAESVESKDAMDELSKLVYNFLQNQEHCRATLTGNGPAITALPLNSRREITALYAANVNTTDTGFVTQPILQKNGIYFGQNIKIRDMFINYSSGISPATLEINVTRNNTSDRTGKGVGGKDLTRKIPIVVKLSSTNQFESCYAVKRPLPGSGEAGNQDLAKITCEALPEMFDWDAARNRCVVRESMCPAGQFMVGLSSTGLITALKRNIINFGGVGIMDKEYADLQVNSIGRVHCRAPRQAINIKDYIDETQRGCVNRHGVRFIKTGNRVRITCL